MFPELSLPKAKLKISKSKEQYYVFDQWRKKEVLLTPEEWVRQHFLHYLVQDLGYPTERIAVEKQILVNGLKRRFDALVYNIHGNPQALFEFKEAEIQLSEEVIFQTAQYNRQLNVPWIIISNGLQHHSISLQDAGEIQILFNHIPSYEAICAVNS